MSQPLPFPSVLLLTSPSQKRFHRKYSRPEMSCSKTKTAGQSMWGPSRQVTEPKLHPDPMTCHLETAEKIEPGHDHPTPAYRSLPPPFTPPLHHPRRRLFHTPP